MMKSERLYNDFEAFGGMTNLMMKRIHFDVSIIVQGTQNVVVIDGANRDLPTRLERHKAC